MALLPLLVTIGLAVGPGRCQNTCSLFWGIDPSLANWVPNFKPDAEETGLDLVGCASTLPVVFVIFHPKIRAMSHVQDCIYYEGEDGFLSRYGLQRIYSDDFPVEECYYKSREHNLGLFFFGLGPDSDNLNYQESVDKRSAINGHLPILDTKNKMEWVKGVFERNIANFSNTWSFYLDGRRRKHASPFVWGDGQPVPLDRSSGGLWEGKFPIPTPGLSYLAAVINNSRISVHVRHST